MHKKMMTYAWVFLGLALLMILAQGVSVILVRLDVPPLLNMFLHHLGHARKVLYFAVTLGLLGLFWGAAHGCKRPQNLVYTVSLILIWAAGFMIFFKGVHFL